MLESILKRLQHSSFPVNFVKFLQKIFEEIFAGDVTIDEFPIWHYTFPRKSVGNLLFLL